MYFEQRNDQRLRLKRLAHGITDQGGIQITDVSVHGLGINHNFPMKVGDRVVIEFTWAGTPVHLQCTVATTRYETKGFYHSGLIVVAGVSAAYYRTCVADAEARFRHEAKANTKLSQDN